MSTVKRRPRHGIRTRIAGGSLLIAMAVSLAAGLIINGQLERIVRDGTIAALRSDSSPYIFALQTRPDDELSGPGLATLIAVVAPNGSIPVFSLPTSLASQMVEFEDDESIAIVEANDSHYILVSTPVDVAGETWHVVAGRDVDEETTVLVQMRLLLIGSFALLVLVFGAGAWLLTTVSLAPVTRLRVSAQALSETSTDELLPVSRADDEIAQLAGTLNDLIERLRASATRERQIVSDASHELRTPLAILRTQLELARAEASSVDQLVADIEGAEHSAARLSGLVTSLLELSKIEAAKLPGSTGAAELDAEAVEAVARAGFGDGAGIGAGAGSRASVEYRSRIDSIPDDALFPLRAEDFGRVIDNLTNNALQAMRSTAQASAAQASTAQASTAQASVTVVVTPVIVTLDGAPGELRLSVKDTAGGLDPEFQPRALERFSRTADARANAHGAGLGLAIVAAIVKNAGGSIELQNDPGVGLEVIVTVPVSRS